MDFIFLNKRSLLIRSSLRYFANYLFITFTIIYIIVLLI